MLRCIDFFFTNFFFKQNLRLFFLVGGVPLSVARRVGDHHQIDGADPQEQRRGGEEEAALLAEADEWSGRN